MTNNTNNTETNTINLNALFVALNDAIDNYDAKHDALHVAFIDRDSRLKQLIDAGITSVQTGNNAISKNPVVLANQLPYAMAKADYNTRFLVKNPKATDTQLKNNLKQKISGLQVFLSTGTFLNNVGRDKPQLEYNLAFEKSETSAMQAYQAKKNLNASIKIAEATKAEVLRNSAAVAAQSKLALAAKNDNDKIEADAKLVRLQAIKKAADLRLIEEEKQAIIKKALSDQATAKKLKDELEAKAKKDALKPAIKTVVATTTTKVNATDNVVSSKAGISEECKLEALELFSELEENQVPASVLRELARLINSKYPVTK
jgi:N-acyl-D-aspartate/D-glutamate deacylase